MIDILKLQNLLTYIYSIKEFEILIDIIAAKQNIANAAESKNLNNFILEINKLNCKDAQLFDGGIVYKLSNTEWIYFKQKFNNIFSGYILNKQQLYFFNDIDIFLLTDTFTKYIPTIEINELNNIIKLSSQGFTITEISLNLKIKKELVSLVVKNYKDKIDENYKENFIDLVIKNANPQNIREYLHMTKKTFQRYKNFYAEEIYRRLHNKGNCELVDYYQNGNIRLKCPFRNGLINGKVCIYDKENNLTKEIDFVNGQIDGDIKICNKNKAPLIIKRKNETENDKIINFKINENEAEKSLFDNAIKLNWEVLEFVPDIYKTEENCLIAFNQDVRALKYFPSIYRTEKICSKALEQNILTFKDIPNKFKTKDLSASFFEKYSKELQHIPFEYRTETMCNIAFEANYDNFRYIPDMYKTAEMCEIAIKHDGNLIAQVPKQYISAKLCTLAVKQKGLSIKYIPPKYITQDIILEAVKKDYHALSLVTIQNENDLAFYVEANPIIFRHLPNKIKTRNLCFVALNKDIENIRYIPTELIDEDICHYFLERAQKKNITRKKQLIDYVLNILENLQNKYLKNQNKNRNSATINSKQILSNSDSYEDIIGSLKYKDIDNLIKIINANDKVFNLTLIKKYYEQSYPKYADKISNLSKSSSFLRIKTDYKNIFYVWLFRQDALEIGLEFSSNDIKLTRYFDSIEKDLKSFFDETLIVGRTKTKTIVYVSTAKYSLDWAINTMHKFISIIDEKLKIFYKSTSKSDYKAVNTDKIKSSESIISKIDNINKFEIKNDMTKDEKEFVEEQEIVSLNIKEGQSTTVQLTRYERNPKNRVAAIKIHGTTCLACGFNFNEFYGEDLAKDFIEVHHIKPVSQGEYTVNPKTDLVPLCSNCHSMIHKEKHPPQTIDEIRNRYKRF